MNQMLLKIVQMMDSTGHSLSGSSKSRTGAQGRWGRRWQWSQHRQGSDHPHHGIVLQYLSRTRLVTVTGPISSPRHAEELSPVWGPFSQEEQEAGPGTGLETGQTTVRVQGPSIHPVSRSLNQEQDWAGHRLLWTFTVPKTKQPFVPLWAGLAP